MAFYGVRDQEGFRADLLGVLLGYMDSESEGSLEEDLNSRRYRALLPEEDYDSDDY